MKEDYPRGSEFIGSANNNETVEFRVVSVPNTLPIVCLFRRESQGSGIVSILGVESVRESVPIISHLVEEDFEIFGLRIRNEEATICKLRFR